MTITSVSIPSDQWEDDSEAVISMWLAEDGDQVDTGDLLAEIMVEKAQFEIRAPATGKLSILMQQDQIVIKGDTIATIS